MGRLLLSWQIVCWPSPVEQRHDRRQRAAIHFPQDQTNVSRVGFFFPFFVLCLMPPTHHPLPFHLLLVHSNSFCCTKPHSQVLEWTHLTVNNTHESNTSNVVMFFLFVCILRGVAKKRAKIRLTYRKKNINIQQMLKQRSFSFP